MLTNILLHTDCRSSNFRSLHTYGVRQMCFLLLSVFQDLDNSQPIHLILSCLSSKSWLRMFHPLHTIIQLFCLDKKRLIGSSANCIFASWLLAFRRYGPLRFERFCWHPSLGIVHLFILINLINNSVIHFLSN